MSELDDPELRAPRATFAKVGAQILNSTAIYILAYLVCHIVVQGSEILVAYQYNIHTIWNPSKINFLIPDPDWRRSAVVLTYGVGQTLCLILAVVAMLRLQTEVEQRGLWKVFLIWVAIHGFNQFFGAMVTDNFLREGFWYSPRWLLWWSDAPAAGLGFFFANAALITGYLLSSTFLRTCDSISLMRLDNRWLLIGSLIFAPWILGTLFINLTKFPKVDFHPLRFSPVITMLEQSHQLSVLLFLFPLALGCRYQMYEMTVERPRATRTRWDVILLTLAAMATFRLVLHRGVRFDPKGWPERRSYLDKYYYQLQDQKQTSDQSTTQPAEQPSGQPANQTQVQ